MEWFALGAHRTEAGDRPALVLDPETAVDLAQAATALGVPAGGLEDGTPFASWETVRPTVLRLAGLAREHPGKLAGLAPVTGQLAAPFRPRRVFAAASNYTDHADEMGTVLAAKAESRPFFFMKADTCIVGPGEAVAIPPESTQVDWEVELAVVIGRRARRIGVADALAHVAGYTVLNDISARDLNVRANHQFKFDWFNGKNFDTFAPFGPWVVPAELVADPQALELRLAVNGELMQQGKTDEMIFTVAEQIAYLSSILTLLPGDVIASGTPDGVGMGRGLFLKPGDQLRAEIEGIGTLDSPVVAEPATLAAPA